MAVAIPKDLSLLNNDEYNNDEYKSIFYQIDSFSDSKTVAFSIVIIDGIVLPTFDTISSRKGHAEIAFIRDAKKALKGQTIRGVHIEITINLSKSPCFTCREDLEDFLESLKKGGATVTFTLRIANLYCGVGTPGGEDKHIEYLASWICHLNRENIVHTLDIQPISVVTEILDYRPPIKDVKDVRPPIKGVSNLDWEIILKKRRDKDTKIATITRIVTTVATIVNKVEQQRVIAQGPVNPRTTLKEKLEAKEKRTFYKSRRSPAPSDVYVAVAQVQIDRAVNNVGRTKQKVFKPIEAHDEGGCCHTIPHIITEIHEKNKKPQSWSIQKSTIVLAATHFPCNDCLVRITSDLHEVTPILILRVANFPYKQFDSICRLFRRYDAGITVELQAIRVAEELGQVYCEKNALEEARQQWKYDKEHRAELDEEAVKEVESITTSLFECKRFRDIQIDITKEVEGELKGRLSFMERLKRLNQIQIDTKKKVEGELEGVLLKEWKQFCHILIDDPTTN